MCSMSGLSSSMLSAAANAIRCAPEGGNCSFPLPLLSLPSPSSPSSPCNPMKGSQGKCELLALIQKFDKDFVGKSQQSTSKAGTESAGTERERL